MSEAQTVADSISELSEQQLIELLLRQDEPAYRYAVRTYHSSMIYLARRIVGEKIADEVVQEAWVSVMRALPKFQGRSKLKTWILTIVSNEAKNRLRKENRQVSLDAMTEDTSGLLNRFDDTEHWAPAVSEWDNESPDALLSQQQLSSCLEQAITELPDLQGATLNLKEKQGYSLKEICNILDVSESNVRVLLHRARNKIFSVIEHFQSTGECCTQTAPGMS